MERSLVAAANYSRTRECILSGNNNKHRHEKATETMMPHATMVAPACPCHLCLSVVTCNSNREQEFRIFAKWKCVCFAGQESKCTFWWVLSVRCQLQLTCHWPRGEWVCVSCVYPGTTPNGHAKKSCTRQIDYAATETCAINLSAKGLPWLALRHCKSSEMLPSHECNWSQVQRWLNSIISLVKGRKVLGGGRGSSRFETLMAGSHAKCSGASFCLQQNKVNLLR